MARYVMTEMARGVSPDGVRVVSEANLLERWKPRIASERGEHYGLGLGIGTYRGLPTLGHAGGSFDFRTLMFMLSEQGIAVVVLTNTAAAGGDFTNVVHRKVMEAFFGDAEDSARSRLDAHGEARREHIAGMIAKLTRDPDPTWVRALTGTYSNANLGTVQVRAGARGGTIDAGEWHSAIAQKKEDDGTVKIVLVDPPLAGGEITVVGADEPPTLIVEYEQQTYVFERARRRWRSARRVARALGAYRAAGGGRGVGHTAGRRSAHRGDPGDRNRFVSRFESAGALMCYCGVVPSEHSSGGPGKVNRGRITKAGNAHLRRILCEASWQYAKRPRPSATLKRRQQGASPALLEISRKAEHRLHGRFVRLAFKGKARQKIAVAVARELLGFVWHIGVTIEQKHRERQQDLRRRRIARDRAPSSRRSRLPAMPDVTRTVRASVMQVQLTTEKTQAPAAGLQPTPGRAKGKGEERRNET